jgi:hypothetical protein
MSSTAQRPPNTVSGKLPPAGKRRRFFLSGNIGQEIRDPDGKIVAWMSCS